MQGEQPSLWLGAGQAGWAWAPLVLAASSLALAVVLTRTRSARIPPHKLLALAAIVAVAGLWGARGLHVLADGQLDAYLWRCLDPTRLGVEGLISERDCWAALRLGRGGLSLYGGLLSGAAAGYLCSRALGLPALLLADAGGLAFPAAIALGRMGCWLAGCCFGQPVELPGSLAPLVTLATPGSLAAAAYGDGVHVWSTQLFEAFGCSALAGLLWALRAQLQRWPGQLFGLSVLGYGILRFCIELLRGDPRGSWFWETTSPSQALAVLTGLGGLWLFRRGRGKDAAPPRVLEAPCIPS